MEFYYYYFQYDDYCCYYYWNEAMMCENWKKNDQKIVINDKSETKETSVCSSKCAAVCEHTHRKKNWILCAWNQNG